MAKAFGEKLADLVLGGHWKAVVSSLVVSCPPVLAVEGWHQEGLGDGRHLKPGQRTQREGQLGLTAERRVPAGEDQPQHVVAQRRLNG